MGGGQRTHQGKEAHAQRSRAGGRRKVNKTAADGHTSEKFNKEGKDRAAVEEDNQVEKVRVQSEKQSAFLREKISAIHVDPEALIQGGESARWVEAFNNAVLPMDPQTPQPGRPGRGLGSGGP